MVSTRPLRGSPSSQLHSLVMQVEQKRFLSLREGAQREARTRQQSSLEESNVREQTRRAERSAELRHARQKLRNKREFVRQYDARLDSLRREHEQVRRSLRSRFPAAQPCASPLGAATCMFCKHVALLLSVSMVLLWESCVH